MVLSSRGELMKNALVYAYIGDSLYECYIRKYLISKNFTKLKDLQHESLNYVSAVSQRKHLELLEQENFLTQHRNISEHPGEHPQRATAYKMPSAPKI